MGNKFDSENYPSNEPAELIVGDRWMWKLTEYGSDYDPASYTLKYSLRHESDPTKEIEITASGSGTDYLIEVASAVTAAKTPGRYHFQAYITRNSDSQRISIRSGSINIKANADESTSDTRSHARKVLDAIEAVLESRASKDQESYTINGRSLARTPIADLLKLRDVYRAETRREEVAEKLKNGTHTPRTIQVRF